MQNSVETDVFERFTIGIWLMLGEVVAFNIHNSK
jgi:hypothetical protein